MTLIDPLEPRRLMAAGDLIPSFGGGDGQVDVKPTTRSYGINASDVAIDDQKRILIAGLYRKQKQIGVTRLNPDGSTDTGFGSDGYATIKLPDTKSFSTFQLTADHNGRVLVLYGKTLHRLTASGKADAKFNGTRARTDVPIVRETTDVFVDADNNPLVIGTSAGKSGDRATLVKLRRTGTLESTFGSGGAYKTPAPSSKSDARGLTLTVLDDGRIVGVADIVPKAQYEVAPAGIYAFRLSRHGVIDTSYGTGTGAEDGLTKLFEVVNDQEKKYVSLAARYEDGSLLLANTFLNGDREDFNRRDWTRLDADGKVARTDIRLPTSANPQAGKKDWETDIIAVQANGKLLAENLGELFRLNADYSRDTSFSPAERLDTLRVASLSHGVFGRGEALLAVTPFIGDGNAVNRSVFSVLLIES